MTAAVYPAPAFCRSLPSKTLRLWATSDPHVGTDLWGHQDRERTRRDSARESLAEAIRQSESAAGFDWDLAVCLPQRLMDSAHRNSARSCR